MCPQSLWKVAARKLDYGFSNDFLENLQTHLQPGTTALVLLVEHKWADDLENALGGGKDVFLQQTLTDALVEEYLEADYDEE